MIELVAGHARVVLDPTAGGRLASLVLGGRERLLGPPSAAAAADTTWGCFFMAPWAGRIGGARFAWEGDVVRLTPNLGAHALHGAVFDEPWQLVERSPTAVELTCPFPRARWALGGRAGQRIELRPGALVLEGWVEAAERALPAALGWHPWFARPARGDVRVQVIADRVLETSDDLLPTGRTRPVSGDTDLRTGPALGPRRLDHVYPDARSPAVVRWEDLSLEIGFEPPLGTIVVHTPAAGFCVEPQSAWPHAPALAAAGVGGTGLVRVPPGDRFQARAEWRWSAGRRGISLPADGRATARGRRGGS